MNRRVLVTVLALLTGSVSIGSAAQSRKPVTHTVVIESMQLSPATLTIRPGDQVTWVNKDIVQHTATTPESAKSAFDSRMIAAGKSWTRTFAGAGTFDYLCTYHPTMKGVIKVVAPGRGNK